MFFEIREVTNKPINYILVCVGANAWLPYKMDEIKPNRARIRFLRIQIVCSPTTGFELAPLIYCITNRLALCPAPYTN